MIFSDGELNHFSESFIIQTWLLSKAGISGLQQKDNFKISWTDPDGPDQDRL